MSKKGKKEFTFPVANYGNDDGMNAVLRRAINEGYRSGRPVLVISDSGALLHGHEILPEGKYSDTPVLAIVVSGISQAVFEATDWPEVLEAAREIFQRRRTN